MNAKKIGDAGELEVIEKVKCPNCNRSLILLPPSYPLYDVQCTACNFKAQIKTASTKSCDCIGVGWGVIPFYDFNGNSIH